MSSHDIPKDDQQKINKWIIVFSQTVGQNLCPLFDFWKIPFSAEVNDTLGELEAFLPQDEMTDFAPQRVATLKDKYNFKK